MTATEFLERFTAIYNTKYDSNAALGYPKFKSSIGPLCIEMIGHITKLEDEIEDLGYALKESGEMEAM